MRTIERSSAFKKDFKRLGKRPDWPNVQVDLSNIVAALAEDRPLPERCRDHALSGRWAGYRECHVYPDVLLIYSKPDSANLRLVRLGSHSDLFT